MEEGKYRFERIDQSHYADMCFISRSAFNIDPGISFYRNKNRTEKFGETNLGFIAYSEKGEPAAFYGVYAHLVEYNGKVYKAVQSGDTMTHKNHVGKGLFTKLARMTYELAKKNGAEFVFGSPNYNSFPGFVKKLDWVCPEKFRDYRIRTITLPFAKVAKKVRLFNFLYRPYLNLVMHYLIVRKAISEILLVKLVLQGSIAMKIFISIKQPLVAGYFQLEVLMSGRK